MSQTRSNDHNVDVSRMTVGEHLDELRSRIVRCILALVLTCIPVAFLGRNLLEWILRPAIIALQAHGQPDDFLQTAPMETVMLYLKFVIIVSFILASPYVFYQIWSFVSSGLYPKEKKWILKLLPISVGLFFVGVAFMYSIVLLITLNFLVGFGEWIHLPQPHPNPLEQRLISDKTLDLPSENGNAPLGLVVPFAESDPESPQPGQVWLNVTERKLKYYLSPDCQLSTQMQVDVRRPLVSTHLKLSDYLTFVTTMTLAFGIAFQIPLVVIALVRIGIFTPDQLRKYRWYVVLVILIAAGLLAPPEITSHMMLSVPMILLFEIGLLIATRQEKRRKNPIK